MSAVQIAGCSGAGKSTIAAMLARRGLVAIDSDEDPLLARFVDAVGNVVEEPEAPDFAWLSLHSWAWNPSRLDELIRAAAQATLYVCGGADNELELADRFSQVFLLEIDEPTMLDRLDARRDYHAWGQIGDTREYLCRKLPELQDRLRASGAIPIDAKQPLGQVVDAILCRTFAYNRQSGLHPGRVEDGEAYRHAQCRDQPEPDHYRGVRPAAQLEVKLQRRHLEHSPPCAGSDPGYLEDADLDHVRHRDDHEQAAEYPKQQLGLGADRQPGQHAAESQRPGIAHDDLGRRRIPPQVPDTTAQYRGRDDRHV
jgi:hypothetical protein